MTVAERPAIRLATWYAYLGEPHVPASMGAGVTTAGPLTVVDPDQSCAIVAVDRGDTPTAVLFDGYLFDRDVLARELGLARGASDGQVAAAAYGRWGSGALDRLDGCYLFAVWDGERDRLVIGHDGLGRHPAFYAAAQGRFCFGGNVQALAASGLVSSAPNRVALALLAFRYWPDAGRTYFEEIRRVRPGHYLDVRRDGSVTEHKYWDPLPADEEPWLPEEQVHAEFEPALARAVARCMAMEPQGIMLSGGVDSVTVAALAAIEVERLRRSPLIAVSGRLGPGEQSYEEVMQSRVSGALGMPHVISTQPEWLEGRDPIQRSLELTDTLPGPGFVFWVGTYTGFYRQTAARGLTTLLTGAGGDNWLSVGDAHAADLLRHLRLGALYRFLQSDLNTGGATLRGVAQRRLWRFGVRPILDAHLDRWLPARKARFHRRRWEERFPGWLCPDPELREAVFESVMHRRTPPRAADGRAPRSYYRHALRSYSNPYMHHENETGFHVSAMCGLRLLSPYHDRQLVSFFCRISPQTHVHGTRSKGLLRPVVERHLPRFGLERQQKVYAPDQQVRATSDFRTSLAKAWRDYKFDALADLGVADARGLITEVSTFETRGPHGLGCMYGLLSAERWTKAIRSL